MEIDTNKIDDAVLGLLWLTLHEERRAWTGADPIVWGLAAVAGLLLTIDRMISRRLVV